MTSETSGLTMSDDGAWCWFQDPRAVRHVGEFDRTYCGWLTKSGDVQVGSYDHDTESVATTTLNAGYEIDDHDSPSILVAEDGHLLVFYSKHGGPDIRYRRSERPEDASAFGPEQSIAPGDEHTYPNPWRMDDGTIYLFYRDGYDDSKGALSYVRSDDGGEEWSGPTELITTGGRGWCVYFKIDGYDGQRLDIATSFAGRSGLGGAPHRNVRHVRFADGALSVADGTTLAVEADFPIELDDAPLVYDSDETDNNAWVWDCAALDDGVVEIAYAVFPSIDRHAYRYARWTGTEWIDVPVTEAGSYITEGNQQKYYSGGIALDHDAGETCYLSTGSHDGSRIQRWERADGEGSWRVTNWSDGREQNVRPVVPRNRHPDVPVLWMRGSYTHYVEDGYETAIVACRP